MKKSIRLFSLLMALVMVFSLSAVVFAEPTEEAVEEAPVVTNAIGTIDNPDAKIYSLEDYELVCENANLALYLNEENADFAIEEKSTGHVWYSNPPARELDGASGAAKMELQSQMLISTLSNKDIYETPNSYTGSVKGGDFKIKKNADGFRISFDFEKYYVIVPMDVTLGENFVEVSVPIEEVESTGNEKRNSTLMSVSLLPFFGAGSSEDEGYFLLPDGAGALLRFNNKKHNYDMYFQDIYGADQNYVQDIYRLVQEDASLPIYGIKQNDQAILAVITEGAGVARVNAYPNGKRSSYANVYPEFTIRGSDSLYLNQADIKVYHKDAPMAKNLAVRLYPVDASQPDYSGMAKTYREHLIKEQGLKKQEKVSSSAFVLNLLGAANRVEYPLGISWTVTKPFTTYTQAIEIAEALKEKGVNDIVISYDEALKGDIDEKRTNGPKLDGALGGKSGFKKLKKYAEENGIELFMNADLVRHHDTGVSQIFNGIKTLFNAPVIRYNYTLSTQHKHTGGPKWTFIKASKLIPFMNKYLATTAKKGLVEGLGLKTFSNNLYTDYSEDFGRDNLIAAFKEILAQGDDLKYGILSDRAADYVIPYSSIITSVPSGSSGFDVCDEAVPFYQMVLKGYVPFSLEALNQSASPNEQMLRALETGAQIQYSWAYDNIGVLKTTDLNNYFSLDYRMWLDQAAENYEKFMDVEKAVGNATIDKHIAYADGVYVTVYENGVAVAVNYNSEPAMLVDMEIPAKGYVLLEGGIEL